MGSSGGRIPVIIDTDPGIDDAVALLLAMASPEIEVLGITAVAGNVPLPVAVGNALSLVELAGHAVPVYAGCARPLVNQLQTAGEEIHGSTGLGNDWPAPATVAQPQHGVDYLIEQCLRYKDNPLTICALGPLTNLAMALVKCPEITRGIQRVLVMGGALRVKGNYTAMALT